MSFYVVLIRTLSILAIVALAGGGALLLAHLTPGGRALVRDRFAGQAVQLLGWAGGVALVAMLGSLYLSDGVGFTPCLLCWYQRIAMYPLVVVGGVAALTRDPAGWRYGLPLAVVGLIVAAYHVALQFQPALDIVSCDAGAPCTGRYVLVFGFVSIPVLAGAAFLLIIGLLVTARTVARAD
ncbi:MAG: disulfide bond formation protein B [Longimicrobiales bacterium]